MQNMPTNINFVSKSNSLTVVSEHEQMIPSNVQGDQQGVHDRAKGDVDHVRPWRPGQHCDGGHSSPAWAQVVIINMVSSIVNMVSIIISMISSIVNMVSTIINMVTSNIEYH